MFDFLNKLGLPLKYAIIGLIGGVLVVFLSRTLGLGSALLQDYTTIPLASALGGAIGGWMRQRKGKVD